jgi:hypothetical protein
VFFTLISVLAAKDNLPVALVMAAMADVLLSRMPTKFEISEDGVRWGGNFVSWDENEGDGG